MRIKSISHAGITVANFERSVQWYHETFGFYLVSETKLGVAETAKLESLYGLKNATVRFGFLRAPGGMVLEVFAFTPKANSEPVSWNKPGFTHVAFDVSKTAQWKKKLEKKGVTFVTDVNVTDGTEWTFLRDPDGNLIELIDLKILRPVVKGLGGLLGRILKRTNLAPIYKTGRSL